MVKPSVGREVCSPNEPGEGVRESEYLLTNNISTGPCISPYCPNMVELPNQMCGGMFADTVTSPSEETIPQLLSCLISKYLTPCITLRRCPVKFPLVDTNYQNSRLGSGEGNGTPLQYSRLENPMDGGAWWAAVHGVAQSQTRLKRLSSSSSRKSRRQRMRRLDGITDSKDMNLSKFQGW